ncbi:hypothetical protein MHUMG1_10631 [Metarhizium humberi]|uniref:Uncharacterized protein n=1 Tax=Metarhizium humberi TaxID=2596975 RepID=A0A9P8M186_9HYPO|nr:hypothetical protein MHUMG1_10631 [Metarhizium humberi]
MANPTRWRVEEFRIEAGADSIHDRLYANWNMQVAVSITIKAVINIGGDDTPYQLTPEDLQTLQLVLKSQDPFPSSWACDTEENEFAHVMPSMARNEALHPKEQQSASTFSKRTYLTYWLRTGKVEWRDFIARIQEPDGNWVTTIDSGSGLYSSIRITGIPPAVYSSNNLDIAKSPVQDGTWVLKINGSPQDQDMYQTEYHVTLSNVQLQKVVCKNTDSLFAYSKKDARSILLYIWPSNNDTSTVTAGFEYGKPTARYYGKPKAQVVMDGKGISGPLHLTLLKFKNTLGVPELAHSGTGNFELWDIYGNSARFAAASTNEWKDIQVQLDR